MLDRQTKFDLNMFIYSSEHKCSGIWLQCQDMSRVMRKPMYAKTVTTKLISTFAFATGIVQFLYFLNPKFPVSSHLLCLYSLVYVDQVRNHIVGFLVHIIIYAFTAKYSVINLSHGQ